MRKTRPYSGRVREKSNPWRTDREGIHFPGREQKEFASVVFDCDILNKKECVDLIKYFSHVLNIPVGFCEAERAGWLNVNF